MPHIHTDPGQHDATISAFIARLDGPEPRILLHLHKLLDTYLQVGGHIELHENPWQALTHEIREESGYDMDQLELLQPKVRMKAASDRIVQHPLPFSYVTHPFGDQDHYHIDISFAFVTAEAPRHPVGEDETDTVTFMTAAEVRALPDDMIYPEIRAACLFVLETLLDAYERVRPPQS